MAKTSGELEQEFIRDLKEKSEKELSEWLLVLKESTIQKRNDLIKWMKEKNGFRHMDASFLVGIYLNGGKPIYVSEEDLLENQISKYEQWRPLFGKSSQFILGNFPDAKMIPKKTYVSYTAKREFAAINIKSKELRIGMDLGDQAFSGKLEKAKLTGPMARISHMIVLKEDRDIDEELLQYLSQSYNRVN